MDANIQDASTRPVFAGRVAPLPESLSV
jgi:hypothetical protein